MNPTATNWPEWNQQQLLAALAEVREALARASGDSAAAPAAMPEPARAAAADDPASALETVCAAFGLSPFERAVLLVCAGPELDAKFTPLLARAQAEPGRGLPTFSLALAALPGAHWSALSPAAPLRRWRLIEVGAGPTLAGSPLRIDERVLHFLCGVDAPDERLRGLIQPCPAAGPLAPTQTEAAAKIARAWGQPPPRPIVQLLGGSASDQRCIAAEACRLVGLHLHAMVAVDVPASAAEREAVARLWERETVLTGAVLLLDAREAEPAELARVTAFARELASATIIAAREPVSGLHPKPVGIDVPSAPPGEQRVLWRDSLGVEKSAALNGEVEAVSQQFQLDAATIREVATADRLSGADAGSLWNHCRRRTRAGMDLAQRIEACASWDDLVLPAEPARLLRELAAHVRHRFRVYQDWGFAAKQSRGLGISALFCGPSGTGKTLAAEVLARELELDLFRIDLSAVVNKYIGETEKNLRRVFDAAEAGGAILLFDEADALFGKRSEVRDSHDRYANIEVGYLLQRMETYRGLAILTTNMKQSLDTAFLRRLRFVISFPFPDAAQRREIWNRVFPAAAPTERLDTAKLARLNVSGGHIRNIALSAAVLAADAREPVRMKHLLHAARSECVKLERPPSESEIGGWT